MHEESSGHKRTSKSARKRAELVDFSEVKIVQVSKKLEPHFGPLFWHKKTPANPMFTGILGAARSGIEGGPYSKPK